MKKVEIDGEQIKDWNSFHNYFKDKFGFPDFYGANMDAWIDCMTYLDNQESGMTSKIWAGKNELVIFEIRNVNTFIHNCREVYDALIECSSFVNYRRIESGDAPLIILSFLKDN
jgi:hypothetical protein